MTTSPTCRIIWRYVGCLVLIVMMVVVVVVCSFFFPLRHCSFHKRTPTHARTHEQTVWHCRVAAECAVDEQLEIDGASIWHPHDLHDLVHLFLGVNELSGEKKAVFFYLYFGRLRYRSATVSTVLDVRYDTVRIFDFFN